MKANNFFGAVAASWWFTGLTHRFPEMTGFDRGMQGAKIDHLRSYSAAQAVLRKTTSGCRWNRTLASYDGAARIPLSCVTLKSNAAMVQTSPMCGRFASQLPPELIARLFRTDSGLPNIAASWNVAPTDPAMVIRGKPDSRERSLDVLQWGLVPYFTKDLKKAQRPINARSETVASSTLFKAALARRRCLVPADAFYEWRAVPDGKQPYAIARTDGAPLAFAGLWESWRDPTGEILRTFTILTAAASADMAHLHTRMPVILEEEDWRAWLGEVPRNPVELLRPAAEGVVRIWPVSRAVNNVRNNGAALLDPFDGPPVKLPSDAPAGMNSA